MAGNSDNIVLLELGRNLKNLRTIRGWSQAHLADLSETTEAQISLIERGLKDPATTTLVKIMWALQVEPNELWPKTV
ncbi:helix-turn-helix transcriptional regulator [uncultured Chitinophaga sp.]|uniref:helix-turn-helix domain-containing protein n=1 Tax=uncultured Chitinophaga sp. TaxID=339340 RepID=UPI0034584C84